MPKGIYLTNRRKQTIIRYFKTHTTAVTAARYGVSMDTVRRVWKDKNGSCRLKKFMKFI